MHGSPRWWWVLEAVNLAASTSRLGKWTSCNHVDFAVRVERQPQMRLWSAGMTRCVRVCGDNRRIAESYDPTPQNHRGPSPLHALLTRILLSPFLTRIPPITLLTRILLSLARRRRRTLTPPPSLYPAPSAIATPPPLSHIAPSPYPAPSAIATLPRQQRPSLSRRPVSPTSSISSAPPPEPISPVRIAPTAAHRSAPLASISPIRIVTDGHLCRSPLCPRVKLLTSLWGNYSIPKDNPYTDDSDLELEVWALGLRNPWRCSFDSARPSYFYCADREDLGDWVSDKTDGRAEGPCWLLSSSQRTTTGVGKNAQKDFAFSCDTFFPTVLSSIFSNLPSPIFLLPGEASSRLTDGISCHGEVTASSTRRRVEERDKAASGIDLVPKFPTQPLSIDLKVNIVHGRSMTGAVATGNSALDLAPGPCCG
uniref:Uncharacterized protein n=1 Tax=Oryza glumipatula TaxID=40148 RepID=A0A0D9YKW5_9ORYZ